jgi:SAM-dependent methyltransferase
MVNFRFPHQSKDALFDHLDEPARTRAEAVAQRLLEHYRLQPFHDDSDARNYRENLFYLELLERALDQARAVFPPRLVAADVGCSSWFYVQGLHALLKWWRAPEGRELALRGYEADALSPGALPLSRLDYARAHIRTLSVDYRPEPFTPEPGAFDFVSMLFPFVFLEDHEEWGLARPLFEPESLLAGAWQSVRPGGLLVVVNQGEKEHRRQGEMLEAAGIPATAVFPHDSLLFSYDLPRYVSVAARRE